MAVLGVKADDDVELDAVGAHIEAVHLQHVFLQHDAAADVLADLGGLVVGGVDGIDAHARQDHAGFFHDLLDDLPLQAVQPVGGVVVRDLDVDRAHEQIRAVAVQDQIVGPGHVLKALYDRLHGAGQFVVDPFAQNAGDGLAEHFVARLQDHQRDHDAEEGFDGEPPDQINSRGGQRGGRDHRVVAGVLAGGDQRVGVDLLASSLDIDAQHQLHDDRHADDHQRGRAVIRRFRVKDLLHGLHQRGQTGVENDDGNDGGREIFGPAVAVGMLLVRLPPGDAGTDDGDDGGERVGEIVDRVQHDGDGVREQADHGLEARQQHVGDDADDAGTHDDPLAIHKNAPNF